MRILRAADHRLMPWKNGGGATTEIAVCPSGAGLDDFDWRVSMARVEVDGPFSVFPGIDRTLAILEGGGIMLDVEGMTPLGLTRQFEPVTFPADAPTAARLVAGPILDLNVMSRRGRLAHGVRFVEVAGEASVETDAAAMLLVAVAGQVGFRAGSDAGELALYDCLLTERPGGTVSLTSDGRATVAVIEFRHI